MCVCFPFPWSSWSSLLTCSYFPFKKTKNNLQCPHLLLPSLSCLLCPLAPKSNRESLLLLGCNPQSCVRDLPSPQSGLPETCSSTALFLVIPSQAVNSAADILSLPWVYNDFPSCDRASCWTIRELRCSKASWWRMPASNLLPWGYCSRRRV